MIIAREVRLGLAVLLLLAISAKVFIAWELGVVLLLLAAPLIYLFRDPVCCVPATPLGVLSPANGTIVSVEAVTDPFLNRPAKCCRINMSFLDIHTLRSPTEGKIKKQWAAEADEPGLKRRFSYWIQTDEGDDIVLSIATGRFAPFVHLDLQCGDRLGQGQRCGYLYFEGVVDLFLPENTRVDFKPGNIVNSGSTILGQLIRNKARPLPEVRVAT